uniref:non-specific serine/threonine protein kinase n=1 Tax=Balaenoptera musculus TaxID=9771 RepID=A0A8C0I5R1_BALMU
LTALDLQLAHIDDFEILRTIGEGTFGKVKLARHILTGTQVAVKVIKKRRQNFSSVQALSQEVCSMKALNHPNIVKLLGVIDTEETFFLVLEYLSGGDMYRYLKIHGRMTEAEARGPFQQLVSALQHCHQRGIVHRDLKPMNLLFDSNMNIKLTDFGLSNKCDDTGLLDTICGTVPYAAPELLLGQSYSGPAVDVWSLGVVLYTMVTGSRPFLGKDLQQLRKQILQGQYPIPPYLSLEIRDLLQKMIPAASGGAHRRPHSLPARWPLHTGVSELGLPSGRKWQNNVSSYQAPRKSPASGGWMMPSPFQEHWWLYRRRFLHFQEKHSATTGIHFYRTLDGHVCSLGCFHDASNHDGEMAVLRSGDISSNRQDDRCLCIQHRRTFHIRTEMISDRTSIYSLFFLCRFLYLYFPHSIHNDSL